MWFTHRQDVLHGDDKHVVCNQKIPVVQDGFNWLQQKFTPKEQKIKTGYEVAHAEDTDTCGSSDEDDCKDEPEQITKHDHFKHIQI